MAKILELGEYIANLVIIAFVLVNFDLQVGTIYAVLAIADALGYYFAVDQRQFDVYPIEKNKRSRYINAVWAMGAYVGFVFIFQFIMTQFNIAGDFDQIIYSTFASTPVLSESIYLKLFIWGILIPIVETKLFFRTLTQWANHIFIKARSNSLLNLQIQSLALFMAGVFTLFHLAAKGITNNAALMATFVFGYISVLLVLHFKEAIQAILLHIINNTKSTMFVLGVGLYNPSGIVAGIPVTIGVILVTWIMMFGEVPLIRGR